jgi:hypothetical protein
VGFFKFAAILVVPERCLLWLAGESLQGHIAFSLFEKAEFSSALAKWIAGNQLTIISISAQLWDFLPQTWCRPRTSEVFALF